MVDEAIEGGSFFVDFLVLLISWSYLQPAKKFFHCYCEIKA
jgi:hypothetical protein